MRRNSATDATKWRLGVANVNLEHKEAKFHGRAIDHRKADGVCLRSAPLSGRRRTREKHAAQMRTSLSALPEYTTESLARCGGAAKVERLVGPTSLSSIPARMASIHDFISGSFRRAMTSLGQALTPV